MYIYIYIERERHIYIYIYIPGLCLHKRPFGYLFAKSLTSRELSKWPLLACPDSGDGPSAEAAASNREDEEAKLLALGAGHLLLVDVNADAELLSG